MEKVAGWAVGVAAVILIIRTVWQLRRQGPCG